MPFAKGQSGNPSGKNNRPWRDAIDRALKGKKVDYAKLDELAEKLIALAGEGEIQALKEVGDRLDGKPAQALTGPDGERLIESIQITFVNP